METMPPLLGGLDDVAIRHGFIQKVYGILCFQLAITTGGAALVLKFGESMMKTNPSLVMVLMVASLIMSVAMMCVFICSPNTMRTTPTNYILLTLFTLAESVMVGFISLQYTQESVLIVLGITSFVVFGLTLFACQTSIDFTGMGAYLFCAMLVLMGFGFIISMVGMFGGGSSEAFHGMRLAYAIGGTLLFSMYIVYDTQLIVGGKHAKHQFGIDDYCMAAISLYIDIIQLFLMLLQLFGSRR
jgi:hypothetical protein